MIKKNSIGGCCLPEGSSLCKAYKANRSMFEEEWGQVAAVEGAGESKPG